MYLFIIIYNISVAQSEISLGGGGPILFYKNLNIINYINNKITLYLCCVNNRYKINCKIRSKRRSSFVEFSTS